MIRKQWKPSRDFQLINHEPCDVDSPENWKINRQCVGDYPEFGGTVSRRVADILHRVSVLDSLPRISRQPAAITTELKAGKADADIEFAREQSEEMQMPSTGAAQKIRTAESVRETINQDGAVLLDIKQGLCFSMNPVGSKIWEMLKRECSLEQIASALEMEFQVPRSQIEADIAAFVSELRKRNLIVDEVPQNKEDKATWFSRLINLRRPRS